MQANCNNLVGLDERLQYNYTLKPSIYLIFNWGQGVFFLVFYKNKSKTDYGMLISYSIHDKIAAIWFTKRSAINNQLYSTGKQNNNTPIMVVKFLSKNIFRVILIPANSMIYTTMFFSIPSEHDLFEDFFWCDSSGAFPLSSSWGSTVGVSWTRAQSVCVHTLTHST